MTTHQRLNDDETACGLKITRRRIAVGAVVAEGATCQVCSPPPPKVFGAAIDLAVHIFRDPEIIEFLMDAETHTGLPLKVFFNKVSKNKKTLSLVKENGAWRKKLDSEMIAQDKYKLNPKYSKEIKDGEAVSAVAAHSGAAGNDEESFIPESIGLSA